MALLCIKKGLLDLQKNHSTQFSAEPAKDNLFQWNATLIVPTATPYENVKFPLSISLLSKYPL